MSTALRLRLGLDASSIHSGGGLGVLLGYLRAWREAGSELEITVFASRPSVLEAVGEIRDLTVVPFGVGMSVPRRLLGQLTRLGREAEARDCEVLLTTNMTVERCSLPQVVLHQNLLLFLERTTWRRIGLGANLCVRSYLAERALRRAAANVFISDHMRRTAERVVAASAARNVVVHNGVGTDVLRGAARPSLWTGDPEILAVTSADRHKDNETLLRALAVLVAERPQEPWTLSIASTAELAQERVWARKLGIADRVRWCGHVTGEQLDELYRSALCLLYTSRIEGFGVPLIEAMARRCPVVAGDASAFPEVVGEAGLLVSPGDPRAFAEAAAALLRDEPLRERLIERGVERVQRFSWADSASRLLRVLQDAVDQAV